jgi:hypothetical protein
VKSAVPVRIAIVDDYDVVVQGLARMFEPMSDRIQVVEVSTNRPGVARADIALIDSFAQTRDVNEVLAEANAERYVLSLAPDLIETWARWSTTARAEPESATPRTASKSGANCSRSTLRTEPGTSRSGSLTTPWLSGYRSGAHGMWRLHWVRSDVPPAETEMDNEEIINVPHERFVRLRSFAGPVGPVGASGVIGGAVQPFGVQLAGHAHTPGGRLSRRERTRRH